MLNDAQRQGTKKMCFGKVDATTPAGIARVCCHFAPPATLAWMSGPYTCAATFSPDASLQQLYEQPWVAWGSALGLVGWQLAYAPCSRLSLHLICCTVGMRFMIGGFPYMVLVSDSSEVRDYEQLKGSREQEAILKWLRTGALRHMFSSHVFSAPPVISCEQRPSTM